MATIIAVYLLIISLLDVAKHCSKWYTIAMNIAICLHDHLYILLLFNKLLCSYIIHQLTFTIYRWNTNVYTFNVTLLLMHEYI